MYSERRKFNRTASVICKVQVGKDFDTKYNAQMLDISAGGIRLELEENVNDFNVGDVVYLQLYVYSCLSEIGLVLEGRIIRTQDSSFAINFISVEEHIQEELDAIIIESIDKGLNNMVYWGPGGKMLQSEEEIV